MEFTSYQFYLTTVEEEANLFCGDFCVNYNMNQIVLQGGIYRVIDSQLCRIINGVSPKFWSN